MKTHWRVLCIASAMLALGTLSTGTASASCAVVTGYKFYDSNRAIQLFYTTDVTQKITIPGIGTDVYPALGNTNIAFALPSTPGDVVFEDPVGCKVTYPLPQPPPTMVPVTLSFYNTTKSSATINVTVNPGSTASVSALPSNRVASQVQVQPSASGNSITVNLNNADGSGTCSSAFTNTQGTLTSSSSINVTASGKGHQPPTCSITHNP